MNRRASILCLYGMLLTLISSAVTVSPASAQYRSQRHHDRDYQIEQTQATDDKSFVTLTGTVEAVNPNDTVTVTLRRGQITLATLASIWPDQSYQVMQVKPGEQILFTAEITPELFASRTVAPLHIMLGNDEYSRVYVHPAYYSMLLDTTYRRCESCVNNVVIDHNRGNYEERKARIFGRVAAITDDDEITVNYKGGTIIVEIDEHDVPADNPIKVDEYLALYGDLDSKWYDENEFRAERIVRLMD